MIGYRAFPGYFGVHGLLTGRNDRRHWVGPLMILALVLAGVVVLRLPGGFHEKSVVSDAASSCSGRLFIAAVLGVADAIRSLVDHLDVRGHYGTLFTLLVVAIIVSADVALLAGTAVGHRRRCFLFVALAFMLVVAFGPGYGPQYAYWFLPALVATYVLLDDAWRRLLRIAYLVAGLTYIFEYGFIPWLGAWVPAAFGDSDWTTERRRIPHPVPTCTREPPALRDVSHRPRRGHQALGRTPRRRAVDGECPSASDVDLTSGSPFARPRPLQLELQLSFLAVAGGRTVAASVLWPCIPGHRHRNARDPMAHPVRSAPHTGRSCRGRLRPRGRAPCA